MLSNKEKVEIFFLAIKLMIAISAFEIASIAHGISFNSDFKNEGKRTDFALVDNFISPSGFPILYKIAFKFCRISEIDSIYFACKIDKQNNSYILSNLFFKPLGHVAKSIEIRGANDTIRFVKISYDLSADIAETINAIIKDSVWQKSNTLTAENSWEAKEPPYHYLLRVNRDKSEAYITIINAEKK